MLKSLLIFTFPNKHIHVSSYCSGKAAYGMLKDMAVNPAKWKGRKILFVHTGGLLGLYDKADQLSSLAGSWRRMELEESVPRKDGTGKMF
jgi:D-cysteine desulfhydrase